ncbi:MAG: hypothetical protein LUQ25_08340 [Methanoregulaceae archaeon]|nr:hypothetical protein [Methanoregulaceae archaeon]
MTAAYVFGVPWMCGNRTIVPVVRKDVIPVHNSLIVLVDVAGIIVQEEDRVYCTSFHHELSARQLAEKVAGGENSKN